MTLLAGRYETIRAIAAGGMATVHLAKATGLGGFERLVAVKVMHPHLSMDPDFVAMFLDEARLAAGIRHPNVVSTIDVQKSDDDLFLVMEYIEGGSLRMLLRALARKKKRMPVDVTLKIFSEALAGLHAAHELRDSEGKPLHLVHRDVSPANILVGADGVSRLTDFGVARAESRISSTRGGQLKGKIPYMPPEQIMGEDLDRRVDVYATGLVLWEALVGRRLFRAPNEGALVHTILAGATESPRQARPDVPEPVDRVCMKALALDPEERYPTAAAFADGLEQAAADANLRVATARTVSALVADVTSEMDEAPVGEGKSAPTPDWSGTWEGGELAGSGPGSASRAKPRRAAPSDDDGRASDADAEAVPQEDAPSDGLPSHSQSTGVASTLSTPSPSEEPARRPRRAWLAIGAAVAVLAVGLGLGLGAADPASSGADTDASDSAEDTSAAATDTADSASPASEAPTASAMSDGTSTASAAPTASALAAAAAPTTPRPAPRPPPTTTRTRTRTRPPATTKPPTSPTGYRPTQL